MPFPRKSSLLLGALSLLFIFSCAPEVQESVYTDTAIADETQTANWFAYGRTHNEQRFFPGADINTENVADLKVDWYLDLPNDVGLVSTPLVIDGTLYFTGTMNIIRAVDATTGEIRWTYDPKVAEEVKGKRKTGWLHNRGISYYEGKIFSATWDGRLVAIDALTGKEIWQVRTFDMERSLYITGTPKAFNGKVIIGNGGTENGPTRGWVTAYDADTGEEAWKFYIVPGNPADGFENEAMEMAAETWTGEWWKHGGGGNAWHGFTYDAELDAIYIGTGNGAPWNRKIRSPDGGDNLFLCSVLALDATTGEYRWHYQTTPGESWDFNSNMDIVLADLTIDGEEVKALMHAPKNGFFYVINRETGKLISAEPFVETTWATHVDMATGKPVEVEGARYEEEPFDVAPMAWGAHSWHAMSYNPKTGLVYLPVINQKARYSDEGVDLINYKSEEFIGGSGVGLDLVGPGQKTFPGSLIAWDPVQQKMVWEIPQDHMHGPGTLTTAGNLVFQGRPNGILNAYDASTGEILWTFEAGLGIAAPPITYKINDRQYISLLVGWGGGYAGLGGVPAAELGWAYRAQTRRLITFSLEGSVEMPKLAAPVVPQPVDDPDFIMDEGLATLGESVYGQCRSCHGGDVVSGGMAPDLRASAVPFSMEAFTQVVRDGARVSMGMPQYPLLTDGDLVALQHYIRKTARRHISDGTASGGSVGGHN